MNRISFKSYLGIFPNPFCKYTIDFDGLGMIEVEKGFLSSDGYAYDLFPISNATYRASVVQKLFGLGDVSFTVTENNVNNVVTLSNIKDPKYIAELLRFHHQSMVEKYFRKTKVVHLSRAT